MNESVTTAIEVKQKEAKALTELVLQLGKATNPDVARSALEASFVETAQTVVLMDIAIKLLEDAHALEIDSDLRDQLLFVLKYNAHLGMEPADGENQ